MSGKLISDEKRVLCSDPACVNNVRIDSGADTWLVTDQTTKRKYVMQTLPGTPALLTMISLMRKVPPSTDLHRLWQRGGGDAGITVTKVAHDHGGPSIERSRKRTMTAHCPDQLIEKRMPNSLKCSTCGCFGHDKRFCDNPDPSLVE